MTVAAYTADAALAALGEGARLLLLPGSRALEEVVRERSSGRWQVWYGGSGATYARRDDGVILRSLRRLGECLGVRDAAAHEACCAIWVGYLRALGLPDHAGIAGVIESLAPQLRYWRVDQGQGERWRSRLCLAGRAECLVARTDRPVVVYDLSSAYPWAYSLTLPGDLVSTAARDLPGHECCVADCDLEVPDDLPIPPLPCPGGAGGWAWPVGSWRGWLAGPEAHLARDLGVIRRIHRVWIWRQCSPLTEYADSLYRLRGEAPDAGVAAVVKLLLNSTFGMLASTASGRVVHVRPSTPPPGGVPIGPDLWQTAPRTRPRIYHPLAGAILTSRVRDRLWRAADACLAPLYLGVDAIHAPLGDPGAPPLSAGLGGWRAEGPWLGGAVYAGPGRYLLRGHAGADRVRHQGLPGPDAVRDLICAGEATVWVEGSALDGRPGHYQRIAWSPDPGVWVGARCYTDGDGTRPPTVAEWHAAAGASVPDCTDLGDPDL